MSNYAIWGLFGPATWPWWLASLAFLVSLRRRRKLASVLAGLAFALFVTLAVLPTGQLLADPLERRFGRPELRGVHIDHIVVLTGAERLAQSARRGAPEVSDAGERIIDGAALARAYPRAKLWIVGGVRHHASPLADIDWTALGWRRLGIPSKQIRLVDGSLNTSENAQRVAAERPKGNILLVTSALHMPRAVACFRANGINPLPYPVDYRNPPVFRPGDRLQLGLLGNMERADRALHEWVGLALYRLQGRTREFFPR